MSLLEVFANIGLMLDDFFAIMSIIGSVMLLFDSVFQSKRRSSNKMVEWSGLGLIFGSVGQFALAATGQMPENVGLIFQMSPSTVNTLLIISFLLLVIRLVLKPKRRVSDSYDNL